MYKEKQHAFVEKPRGHVRKCHTGSPVTAAAASGEEKETFSDARISSREFSDYKMIFTWANQKACLV